MKCLWSPLGLFLQLLQSLGQVQGQLYGKGSRIPLQVAHSIGGSCRGRPAFQCALPVPVSLDLDLVYTQFLVFLPLPCWADL